MYYDDFKSDLQKAKPAEHIVYSYLAGVGKVTDISEIPAYYHKGDLLFNDSTFVEVKDDSRIAETQNVWCETANYYPDTNRTIPGNIPTFWR